MSSVYTITSMFMIIIICVLLWKIWRFPLKNSAKRAYMVFTSSVGIYILMDVLFAYCFVHPETSLKIFRIVALLFYFAYITLPLAWYSFSQSFIGGNTSRAIKILLYIPYGILLFMVVYGVLNQNSVWIINEEVRYDRGPLFGIFSLLNLIYYVIPILRILVIFCSRKSEKRQYLFQTFIFSAIPLVGVLANTYVIPVEDLYPFQPFCFLAGTLFAYLFLVEQQYTEENQKKTQLLEEALEKEKENKKRIRKQENRTNQYRKAILSGAIATYEVNLTKDILEGVVIYENGTEKQLDCYWGGPVPCGFSEFIVRSSANMSKEEKEQFWGCNNVEYLLDCFRQGKLEMQIEYNGKNPEKEYIRLRKNYILTQAPAGGDVYALIVTKDISEEYEEKRQQEMQLQSQMEIIQALGSEFSSIYRVDFEAEKITKLSSNGQYRIITNVTDAAENYNEVFELYADVAIYPEDRKEFLEAVRPERILKELQNHAECDVNYRRVVNGVMDYAQIRFIKIGKESSSRTICAVRSIDEFVKKEKQQQEELEKALVRAQNAEKAKTEFLFNMSHDIRTPMNAILGFSTLAEKHIDDRAQALDSLQKLNVAGEHMLRLINNVLDMARIESGKVELDLQAHRIPDELEKLKAVFSAELSRKKLTFTVKADVQNEIAFFDLLRMEQVELNLLSNAVKFTPEGGNIFYTVRQIGTEEGYALYEGTVRDTGIGMSEEFCNHVFEEFEREKTSTVTGVEGTGLGLAIAKSLLELMGGTISCKSEQGVGSEFTFRVRFKTGKESDLVKRDIFPESRTKFTGKRLLVVEDNELNREIAFALLKDMGFEIDTAKDGVEAVAKLAHSQAGYYALVLMDIQMPNMDGYQATRKIRQFPDRQLAQIPIVAMTANAFEDDKRNALAAGMNGHIAKPIGADKLFSELKRFL